MDLQAEESLHRSIRLVVVDEDGGHVAVEDVHQRGAARDDVQLVPVIDFDDGAQRLAVFELADLTAERRCRRRCRRWLPAPTATLPARRDRLAAAALALLRVVGTGVLNRPARREEAGAAALFIEHAGVV